MAITAQTSKLALLALLNADNKTNLTLDQVALAAPAAIADAAAGDRNTTVTVTGVDADKLSGSVDVKYTRQDISKSLSVSKYEFSNPAATAEEVVAEIVSGVLAKQPVPYEEGSYTAVATAIAAEDEKSQGGLYNWEVAITVNGHYVLTGAATVLVNSSKQELSAVVGTTDLNGFSEDDVKA
ncbi:hypothetical protein pEaSNUABM54_00042 [Erwinia phage pEa_SNUABM_54]|nr:hypothetical protein pEaSNUABM54_00042 [Erwinia phage pEa_SNUABM_54]